MKQPLILIMVSLLWLGGSMGFGQTTQPDTVKHPGIVDSTDKALEEELAKELGESSDSSDTVIPVMPVPVTGTTVRRSTVLNPQISVVGTFFASGTETGVVVKNKNVGLAEAEIALRAYVDPYSRADFFVAFGHESEDPFEGPDSAIAGSGEFTTELEEGYVTTLALPFGLQLRGGKFRTTFGKINPIHPHALNYLDIPRMYVNFLGGDGLSDAGLSLSWLVPNPFGFFQELTLEALSGAVEAPSFSGEGFDLLYLGHLKNFFDLTENSTLEIGLSGITGKNDGEGHRTTIGGADVTYKWKPLRRNRYRSFEWTTEALISHRNSLHGTINSKALYSFLRYQIAKRWFVGIRYDYSEFPESSQMNEKAYSAILSFFATEFQKLEVEYQYGQPAERSSFNRVLLRAIFVIGAHGAHQY